MLTTVHETQPEPVHSSDQVLLSSTTPCNAIAAPPASTSQTFTEVTILHKDDSGQKTAFTVKIKRVGQVKFHLCPYNCNTSFKKPSDLIRHIRTHTLEKPYSVRNIFLPVPKLFQIGRGENKLDGLNYWYKIITICFLYIL